MSTPEGKTKKLIKNWEKKNQDLIKLWGIVPSAFGNSTGVSDFVGILKTGKFVAIEAKADGKKENLSKLQKLFLETVQKFGGLTFVVSNEEDLIEVDKVVRDEI